jgi:hypothetical protein
MTDAIRPKYRYGVPYMRISVWCARVGALIRVGYGDTCPECGSVHQEQLMVSALLETRIEEKDAMLEKTRAVLQMLLDAAVAGSEKEKFRVQKKAAEVLRETLDV